MTAELVIKGGTVFDGSGAAGRIADVAISGGVIEAIGPNLRGERELDATGCAVAPGFIDIHTHYDAQVFWDPALRPSSYHGVTTVVAGNCGFTIAPPHRKRPGACASWCAKRSRAVPQGSRRASRMRIAASTASPSPAASRSGTKSRRCSGPSARRAKASC